MSEPNFKSIDILSNEISKIYDIVKELIGPEYEDYFDGVVEDVREEMLKTEQEEKWLKEFELLCEARKYLYEGLVRLRRIKGAKQSKADKDEDLKEALDEFINGPPGYVREDEIGGDLYTNHEGKEGE